MPGRLLAIEHRPQEMDAGCLAACVQMAMAHLGLGVSQADLNRLLELTPGGIPTLRLTRLEQHYDVLVTLRCGTLDDLIRALERDLPPIVFVRTGQLPYWTIDTQHALLIRGYEGSTFLVNDPAFLTAPQHIAALDLSLAWDEFDNRYALLSRTKVGRS